MASPSVTTNEIDLSTFVPSFPGVNGSGVVRSKRGSTSKPLLVSSTSSYLLNYTANEKINIGDSSEHYSFLQYLKKGGIWIMRASKNAKYGLSIIEKGLSDIANTFSGAVSYSGTADILTVSSYLGRKMATGTPITFANTGGGLPPSLVAGTRYFVYKLSNTSFKVCANLVDALADIPTFVAVTGSGTGTHTVSIIQNLISGNFTSDFITNENTFSISASLGKSLQTGSHVLISTEGTISTGLTNNSFYYVIKLSDSKIKFATSQANALLGTAIAITGAGTGTFKLISKANHHINLIHNFTINTGNNTIVVPAQIGSLFTTGDSMILDTEGSLTGTGLTAGTTYYAVKVSDTELKVATSQSNALLPTPTVVTLTAVGTVNHYIEKLDGCIDPTAYFFGSNEVMLVTAKDEGDWSSPDSAGSVQYSITDFRNKESNAFSFNIFKTSNLSVPVEDPFICSRVISQVNGDNANIYVENVIDSSSYVNIINNPLITETDFPLLGYIPVSFIGGDDGDPITEAEMIQSLNKFSNKDDINCTLVLDGGYATVAYHQAITSLCESRKDCFGILSIPKDTETGANVDVVVDNIIAYRQSTNINSSYVGFYSSHQLVMDEYNNRKIYIAPDGFVGAIICFNADNYKFYYAPAGWKRASILSIDPLQKFDKPQRDRLYDAGINPIKYKRNRGISVFGQKTALTRASALDRVNVRLLLIQMEPANENAMEDFEFEYNNASVRNEAKTIIDDYMKTLSDGLYDFYTNVDNPTTNIDRYKFKVRIFVKPAKTMEFIEIDVIITRTDTDFSTAIALV